MTQTIRPLLIFPPGWTPFAPYLALPALKGYLKDNDISVEIRDMNVEFFDHILSESYLRKSHEIVVEKVWAMEKQGSLCDLEGEKYRRLVKAALAGNAISDVGRAKATIRSQEYYAKGCSQQVDRVLFDGLALASARHDGLDIRFNSIKLKYSYSSTNSILQSLTDSEANPYIDFFGNGLIKELENSDRNFLGISITSNSQLIPAITLAHLVREKCQNIKHIVLGGNLVTRLVRGFESPHPLFNLVDYIITYEGEKGLLSLVRTLESDKPDLRSVPSLCYVQGETLIKNLPSSLPVEELASPDFSDYFHVPYFLPDLVLPMYSSKSCFAKCTFCTIPSATSGKYRVIPIDTIYDTMSRLSQEFNTQYFTFVDETFAAPIMKKLAEKIVANDAKLYWYGETRFTPHFTEEFCQFLYKGGCRKIQFGLESYTQRVLDLMKKETKVEWIEPAVENCLSAGIAVHMFFMVGFPTETKEEALQTIQFSKKMLHRSKFVYNNPHSTRGWGTFGLDKYSAIWMNPDYFKIRIKDPGADSDLALQYEYESSEGLSSQQASDLAKMNGRDPYLVLQKTELSTFHSNPTTLYSEELPFIRICRGEYYEESASTGPVVSNIVSCLTAQDRIALSPDTFVMRIKYDLSKRAYSGSFVWILYNAKRNAYHVVEDKYGWMIASAKLGELKLEDIPDKSAKFVVDELLAYGFLRANGYHAGNLPNFDWNIKIDYNPGTMSIPGDDGKSEFLFIFSIGSILKFNRGADKLLANFCGGSTPSEVFNKMKERGVKFDESHFQNFIQVCIKHGFLRIWSSGGSMFTNPKMRGGDHDDRGRTIASGMRSGAECR